MSTRLTNAMLSAFTELRHEPVRKRVRALVGGEPVVDTVRAMVVYEPRRVVPSYAVPVEDVHAELVSAAAPAGDAGDAGYAMDDPALHGLPVLDPSIPFAVHTAGGRSVSLRMNGHRRDGIGFLPADPDLAGYVIVDFDGFDAWLDEDEPVVGHPHDPFHSIEILSSSREVQVQLDGVVLAASSRAQLLFEGTILPVRAYLPREDVLVDLRPSAKRTCCAYKGEASYWSADVAGRTHEDIAWTYEAPLRTAAPVAGAVAFFNERTDLVLDGEYQPRPRTPWS